MNPRLHLFFLAFGFSLKTLADCTGSGLYFWPSNGQLLENPMLMIEGYANSQEIIHQLNQDHRIYLRSDQESVSLTVQEICVGQFYLTQALLVPERSLKPGSTYQLVIENTPDDLNPLRTWNSSTASYEPVQWTVIAGTDTIAPTWTQKPDESKKTLVRYGCGPSMHVHFNFAIYDESPLLIKATVIATKSKKSTSYYLDATDLTSVAIGHGMCSGAFTFDETDYTVSFDLLDGSGNQSTWEYEPVKFSRPTELNSLFQD